VILGLAILATVLRELIFFGICINSSKRMHKDMFNSVMSTPIRFFDLNPLGRIMNRFSKDINLLDETIPWCINDFMHVSKFFLNLKI
jgi:ATP-binding cassette subfamily C (CFTR/MRP) protein 4